MTGTSRAIVGLTLILVTGACASRVPVSQNGKATELAQASTMADIQDRWEQQCKTLDRAKLPKEYPQRKLDILVKILEEIPDSQLNAELERLQKDPTEYEQLSEYHRYFLQAFFLIHRKDRAALVQLLAAKCPRFIATSPIELEVASLEVTEPFLTLFDSYQIANREGKKRLAGILRDSLKDLSQEYPNDDEFVAKARDWYVNNASQISINPYYHPFMPVAEQRDLFVRKHS